MVLKSTIKARKKREAAKMEAVRQQAFREGYQQAEKEVHNKLMSGSTEWSKMEPETEKGKLLQTALHRATLGGLISQKSEVIQEFSSGATRDLSHDKYDYEGFLSPTVIEAFGAFMHANRQTAAGLRDSDNWQKGIPFAAYMKSLFRHFHAAWKGHRAGGESPLMVTDLLAVIFNAQGYLHEYMRERGISASEVYELARQARQMELAKRAEGQNGSP